MNKRNSIVLTSCAPPNCKCPELEVYASEDEQVRVTIADDYSGVVNMSFSEFSLLAIRFLNKFYLKDEQDGAV